DEDLKREAAHEQAAAAEPIGERADDGRGDDAADAVGGENRSDEAERQPGLRADDGENRKRDAARDSGEQHSRSERPRGPLGGAALGGVRGLWSQRYVSDRNPSRRSQCFSAAPFSYTVCP